MTHPPSNTDIATILEALRTEVRAQRMALPNEDAAAYGHAHELQRAAEQLEYTRVVSAHWPLEGKNLYEQGWALLNKVVRRYLRWYINPIVEQQNAYNEASARTIRLLIEQNSALHQQLAELQRELEALRTQ
ncbi:MAG: hypothetical protein EOM24_16645 [Chloroflexia bacterium]|nr:hypothetical protein [Chloroflexia bacterium]